MEKLSMWFIIKYVVSKTKVLFTENKKGALGN